MSKQEPVTLEKALEMARYAIEDTNGLLFVGAAYTLYMANYLIENEEKLREMERQRAEPNTDRRTPRRPAVKKRKDRP